MSHLNQTVCRGFPVDVVAEPSGRRERVYLKENADQISNRFVYRLLRRQMNLRLRKVERVMQRDLNHILIRLWSPLDDADEAERLVSATFDRFIARLSRLGGEKGGARS